MNASGELKIIIIINYAIIILTAEDCKVNLFIIIGVAVITFIITLQNFKGFNLNWVHLILYSKTDWY